MYEYKANGGAKKWRSQMELRLRFALCEKGPHHSIMGCKSDTIIHTALPAEKKVICTSQPRSRHLAVVKGGGRGGGGGNLEVRAGSIKAQL
jgi:hypothetical protein